MISESRKQILAAVFAISIFVPVVFFLLFELNSLDLGWIFLLAGASLLAFTTVRNFIETFGANANKIVSIEAETGIICVGLGLASPIKSLSYYFYGIVILGFVFFFIRLLFKKTT